MDGTTVISYEYDAWGNVIDEELYNSVYYWVSTLQVYRYRSYIYDNDTGFYYLQSRYYDPTVGRFLNADDTSYLGYSETVLAYNLYAYCENDAINFIDPLGAWIRTYKGFNKTKLGFSVKMDYAFLSKSFCLSFAGQFIKLYGNNKKVYSGMNKERIAKELYGHAILYITGMGLITTSYVSSKISQYFKYTSIRSISFVVSTISGKLGKYFFSRTSTIDINSDESFLRMAVYNIIWINMKG